MNSVFAFLSELSRLDIKLRISDGQLRISAPQGALTPELTDQLRSRKAEILEFLDRNQSESGVPPIQPVSRTEPLPLSFAQQRLWFMEQLGSGAIYTMIAAYQLQGPLDVPALERTFTEIVRRHESVRLPRCMCLLWISSICIPSNKRRKCGASPTRKRYGLSI